MSNRVRDLPEGWHVVTLDIKRVREGVEKMGQALERDYIESQNRPSGLPKDWRNRIIY